MDFTPLLSRHRHRHPFPFVDHVSIDAVAGRASASKVITVNEEYFQGHFPGTPLMPGVLMLEALTQAASLLLLARPETTPTTDVALRAVEDVKFRRHVVPGDRLAVAVTLHRVRGPIARVRGQAEVDGHVVVEATLVMAVRTDAVVIHPTAAVHPSAVLGPGTTVGAHATVGPAVVLGRFVKVGPSAVIDGDTHIGDHTDIHPFASIGLPPQDLKYRGEPTRVVIGARNVIRECVTIHRGTHGGGGETRIGDKNLFMAYAHIAHDCIVGSHTIFGPGATLGGHVTVEDHALISAYSGVHQFCRVGQHAFIGGYSVVTMDALPFARTVGNRARVYGLNSVGLQRRGFQPDTVRKLKRAYRHLLTSRLTPSKALDAIEADEALACPEVAYLVAFIRSSKRGVTLKRPGKRAADGEE